MLLLEVYDRNRNKVAVLQNSFNMTENVILNGVSNFAFTLPANDPKNSHCKPLNMVRIDDGELYRITGQGEKESDKSEITYSCEHVIATLLSTSLYGYHVVGNRGVYTADVIRYVLAKQRDWVLAECDFSRQFEYGWEQENLLSALFSIPNRFTEKYRWVTDTTVYPWKLSLKLIDENALPKAYARKGHNRLSLTKDIDYSKVVTRLYALGAGEGVNQLKIDGNYLQSPKEITDKYGIIEYIWTDRRYTDKESLRQSAAAMLGELEQPYIEYSVDFIGECNVGDMVEIVGEWKSFVIGKTIAYGDVPSISYKLANKPTDVASSLADIADRQRIEMTYSQGATQIYADSIADNADSKNPCELRFFIPETMAIINSVRCRIRLSRFRAYSATSVSGGAVTTSKTNSTRSTDSGGGESSENNEGVFINAATSREDGSEGEHLHRYSYELLEHTHDIPSHSHKIGGHSHEIDTTHEHKITPVISLFGSANSFTLFINGAQKKVYAQTDAETDITDYLVSGGSIPRGQWFTIGVLPNDLARVEIAYNVGGFIQSRGDKTL